jgi:hypothetical protein
MKEFVIRQVVNGWILETGDRFDERDTFVAKSKDELLSILTVELDKPEPVETND